MKIVFRGDASTHIGTGHVSRLSAIAEEAISRGHECIFVGEINGPEWLIKKITNMGFSKILTDLRFNEINTKDYVLIIDSYQIPAGNSFIKRDRWKYVVNIADSETPNYGCDLVLHPALDNFEAYADNQSVLWGGQYLLIRKSLKSIYQYRLNNVNKSTILVTGGGTDPYRFCKEIYTIIRNFELSYNVVFISNDEFLLVESIKKSFPSNFRVIPIGTEFESALKEAKLAICPASTTSIEMVAIGIPTAIACTARNQESYYKYLTSNDICSPIGYLDQSLNWRLDSGNLSRFITGKNTHEEINIGKIAGIDFKGAERILDKIEEDLNFENN